MKKFATFSVLFYLLFSFVSCKKDNTEIKLSKNELLTQEIWYINKYEEYTDGNLTDSGNIHNHSFTFYTDYTYDYTEDINDVANTTTHGTWKLSDDETNITTNPGTDKSTVLEIVELTNDSFIYFETLDNIKNKLFLTHSKS